MSRKPNDEMVAGVIACDETDETVDGGVTAAEFVAKFGVLLLLLFRLPLLPGPEPPLSSGSAGGVSGVYQPPCGAGTLEADVFDGDIC